MDVPPQKTRCRHAVTRDDIAAVIDLSHRVQNALTASGSQQVIGPLAREHVEHAVSRQDCFVLVLPTDVDVDDDDTRIVACGNQESTQRCTTEPIIGTLLFQPLSISHFARTSTFDITRYPRPWYFLGSIMLAPEYQRTGRGLGEAFVKEAVAQFCMHRIGCFSHDELQYNAADTTTADTTAAAAGGGTILLDCWAGAHKLRAFYLRCGFQFAAIVPQEDYEIAIFTYAMQDG